MDSGATLPGQKSFCHLLCDMGSVTKLYSALVSSSVKWGCRKDDISLIYERA